MRAELIEAIKEIENFLTFYNDATIPYAIRRNAYTKLYRRMSKDGLREVVLPWSFSGEGQVYPFASDCVIFVRDGENNILKSFITNKSYLKTHWVDKAFLSLFNYIPFVPIGKFNFKSMEEAVTLVTYYVNYFTKEITDGEWETEVRVNKENNIEARTMTKAVKPDGARVACSDWNIIDTSIKYYASPLKSF